MENETLALKFRESVDAVIERYGYEHQEYLYRVANSGHYAKRQYPDIHPTITGFIGNRWTDIVEMDVFKEACDYALSNFEIIERYHAIGEDLQWGIDHVLLDFVGDVLGYTGLKFEYSDEDFQTIYGNYERDLLSETLPQRTFVCLQGFKPEDGLEEIEIADNVVIREMSDHDFMRVAESSSPEAIFAEQTLSDRVLSPISGPNLSYILEIWLDVEKDDLLPNEESPDEFPDYVSERHWSVRNAITALRLVNERGTVNYGQRFSEGMGAWQSGSGGGLSWDQPLAWNAEYKLAQDDVEDLREIFSLLQSKDFDSIDTNLRMSVERFNSSTLRSNWRVEFSDLIIIMEALMSKKKLSGRELAQRVAILLGGSLEERQDIYEDVYNLWETRGSVWGVAHGGGRTELKERDEVLDRARYYAAECLIKILKLERGHGGLGNLLKNMDEKMNESMLDVEFPE